MRAERISIAVLVVSLLLAGGAGWWLALEPTLHGDPSSLATLPRKLAGFTGEDLPIDSAVESMLRADFNLQRAYVHAFGDVVWLYLGYYGTARGGTPEHTPGVCYGANGWDIVHDAAVTFPDAAKGHAREFIVEQAGQRRLVLFWFRSYRNRTLASTAALLVDHFVGRLRAGRADGALVRLSTPLGRDEDIETARRRLRVFAASLEPEIEARWPDEQRVSPPASATAHAGS